MHSSSPTPSKNLICHPAPDDKRKYVRDIGRILVATHGKRKFYRPRQVKEAHRRSTWADLDFSCWGMSVYSSHRDFDDYHRSTAEVCDYTAMKSQMLEGISTSDVHLSELPEVDIDISWLDFGIFEGILTGVGEFFSAIAEGIVDGIDV